MSALEGALDLVKGAGLSAVISLPRKKFVKEHTNLIRVLKSGTKKQRLAEAKEQSTELKGGVRRVAAGGAGEGWFIVEDEGGAAVRLAGPFASEAEATQAMGRLSPPRVRRAAAAPAAPQRQGQRRPREMDAAARRRVRQRGENVRAELMGEQPEVVTDEEEEAKEETDSDTSVEGGYFHSVKKGESMSKRIADHLFHLRPYKGGALIGAGDTPTSHLRNAANMLGLLVMDAEDGEEPSEDTVRDIKARIRAAGLEADFLAPFEAAVKAHTPEAYDALSKKMVEWAVLRGGRRKKEDTKQMKESVAWVTETYDLEEDELDEVKEYLKRHPSASKGQIHSFIESLEERDWLAKNEAASALSVTPPEFVGSSKKSGYVKRMVSEKKASILGRVGKPSEDLRKRIGKKQESKKASAMNTAMNIEDLQRLVRSYVPHEFKDSYIKFLKNVRAGEKAEHQNRDVKYGDGEKYHMWESTKSYPVVSLAEFGTKFVEVECLWDKSKPNTSRTSQIRLELHYEKPVLSEGYPLTSISVLITSFDKRIGKMSPSAALSEAIRCLEETKVESPKDAKWGKDYKKGVEEALTNEMKSDFPEIYFTKWTPADVDDRLMERLTERRDPDNSRLLAYLKAKGVKGVTKATKRDTLKSKLPDRPVPGDEELLVRLSDVDVRERKVVTPEVIQKVVQSL